TSIGYQVFYACFSLTNISVAASNPAYSSLSGVLFDKAQTTLIQFHVGLGGSYTIPNTVTNIGDYSFYSGSSLTNVTITGNVIRIGVDAFGGCNGLTNVTIPNNVTTIGGSAFAYCIKLAKETIGNGVATIGDSAFFECTAL